MTQLSLRTLVLPALLAFAGVLALGCKNPNYCEGNPHDDCRLMWDAPHNDGPTACSTSAQCMAPTAVCDTSAGTCVQCIAGAEEDACTGTTPVCGENHACRGCTAHAECESLACLPDGSCAAASAVAYVSSSASGSDCTQTDPCPLLKDAIAKNRPYVKIAANGAANDSATVVIDGKVVTILAEPNAVLDRDGDGPVLEVRSANADVAIYDLHVTGATGLSGGHGLVLTPNGGQPKLTLVRGKVDNNQGGGISSSGGTLTVSQSTVSGNTGGGISSSGGTLTVSQSTVSGNTGGGISVTGTGVTFDITNTYIFRNGDQDTGAYGGVNLGIATAGTNRFEFNTVVDNRAAINSGGVICNVAAFTGPNNIISRNSLGGDPTAANAQTFGACTYPTSAVQNDHAGLLFEQPDSPGPFNYRLKANSSAIDQGTTPSSIVVDHDGDTRPTGAAKDMGADEYVP
jgi:hypothetical protein